MVGGRHQVDECLVDGVAPDDGTCPHPTRPLAHRQRVKPPRHQRHRVDYFRFRSDVSSGRVESDDRRARRDADGHARRHYFRRKLRPGVDDQDAQIPDVGQRRTSAIGARDRDDVDRVVAAAEGDGRVQLEVAAADRRQPEVRIVNGAVDDRRVSGVGVGDGDVGEEGARWGAVADLGPPSARRRQRRQREPWRVVVDVAHRDAHSRVDRKCGGSSDVDGN